MLFLGGKLINKAMITLQRNRLIKLAVEWVKSYSGKRIIYGAYGFAKHLGIDKLCAVTELRLIRNRNIRRL